MTIEETLKQNSSEYQQHISTRNKITRVLQHQNNIRLFKTIPKHYQPSATPEIVTHNPTLSNEFQTAFQQLFFKNLNDVITNNTISLELENSRLREIITRTENQLSTLASPAHVIAQLHLKFYIQNNIPVGQKTSQQPKCPQSPAQVQPKPTGPSTSMVQPSKTQRRIQRKRKSQANQPSAQKASRTEQHFFVPKPPPQATDVTLHNLTTLQLTAQDYQLLTKGLSFSPTPTTSAEVLQQQILQSFNDFARSLRLKFMRIRHTNQAQHQHSQKTTTISYLYRSMKFLPKPKPETQLERYTDVGQLENYIERTKQQIADSLNALGDNGTPNLSRIQRTALSKLQRWRHTLTIKPADKNLGVVLMHTNDYITQCMLHLTDSTTHRLATNYPAEDKERTPTCCGSIEATTGNPPQTPLLLSERRPSPTPHPPLL